jgi:hypothetical protein
MTIVPNTTDTARAAYIDGLRQIADWLEQHPEVPTPHLGHAGSAKLIATNTPTLSIYVWNDPKKQMAAIARAMGTAEKEHDGDRFRLIRHFAGIALAVSATRDEVCERVVTGTREVTEKVRDPEALAAVPLVEVTRTMEDVEWICPPLLADAVSS